MCGFDIFHYATIKRIGRKFSRYCCRFPGCVPAIRLCRSIPGRRRRAWRLVSGSACASLTCPLHCGEFPASDLSKDCRTDVLSMKGLASCRSSLRRIQSDCIATAFCFCITRLTAVGFFYFHCQILIKVTELTSFRHPPFCHFDRSNAQWRNLYSFIYKD